MVVMNIYQVNNPPPFIYLYFYNVHGKIKINLLKLRCTFIFRPYLLYLTLTHSLFIHFD